MTKTEELAEALIGVADAVTALARALNTDDKEEPEQEAKEDGVTLEQVRAVLADKSRAGHTDEIRNLLSKYGSSRLSGISPKHYAELLKDAEGLKDE